MKSCDFFIKLINWVHVIPLNLRCIPVLTKVAKVPEECRGSDWQYDTRSCYRHPKASLIVCH